jgi:hypothetical protein
VTAATTPDGRKAFYGLFERRARPNGRNPQQPVRASKVEVVDGYFTFTLSDGTLSALFHLSAVRNWREADESG